MVHRWRDRRPTDFVLSAPLTAGLDEAILSAATLVEFAGAFFILTGTVRAFAWLCRGRGDAYGVIRGRLALADGVVAALGFKTAATLLKTLELRSWNAIAFFAAVLALRTFVKLTLQWEARRLRDVASRFAVFRPAKVPPLSG